MPPQSKKLAGISLDSKIPLPWVIAVLVAIVGFVLNDHNQILANKRVNDEQDTAIKNIEQGRVADQKANQEMRESLIAFNGKMDTLNAKMDGMRSALSVGSIKAEIGAR